MRPIKQLHQDPLSNTTRYHHTCVFRIQLKWPPHVMLLPFFFHSLDQFLHPKPTPTTKITTSPTSLISTLAKNADHADSRMLSTNSEREKRGWSFTIYNYWFGPTWVLVGRIVGTKVMQVQRHEKNVSFIFVLYAAIYSNRLARWC